MPSATCDATVLRNVMAFIYTGYYGPEASDTVDILSSSTDSCAGSTSVYNTRKRKRNSSHCTSALTSNRRKFHPSILHLKVNAAAGNLAFNRLQAYAKGKLISSLVVLFSQDQFKDFIIEVYSDERYFDLIGEIMDVITANMEKFTEDSYPLIDKALFEMKPLFRDHLLDQLIRDRRQRRPSSVIEIDDAENGSTFHQRQILEAIARSVAQDHRRRRVPCRRSFFSRRAGFSSTQSIAT